MKISDDVRRDIAARLREKHEYWRSDKPDTWYPQMAGSYEIAYLHDLEGCIPCGESLFIVLANLIEPEPERTCRMTKKGPEFVLAGWWECSECGPVYPPCNDEIAVWALQKCPRCGAKVVG